MCRNHLKILVLFIEIKIILLHKTLQQRLKLAKPVNLELITDQLYK